MGYYTGIAANPNDIVLAIQNAAVDSGWTLDRQAALGTGNAEGREALLHKGDIYVQLRSMADSWGMWTSQTAWLRGPAVFIAGSTGYDAGLAWDVQPGTSWTTQGTSPEQAVFIGTAPNSSTGQSAQVIEFPAPYRVFTFSNPDVVLCIIRCSATTYQWIMFGAIEKFGTWTGGTFVAASQCGHTVHGGNYSTWPSYSIGGSSRGRSYAPFHDMTASYNPGLTPENTVNSRLYIDIPGDTGASATYKWSWNNRQNPYSSSVFYRAVQGANSLTDPVNSRSPNLFNQVAPMSPFMLMTQRDNEPNWAIIGRLGHVRQIPLDNFNPEDTFMLGADKWMVFPYFEKGGVTGRYGWAINANEVP